MVLSMRLDEPGEANTFRCGKDDVLLPAFNVQCAAFLMEVRSDYFYCQQPLTCFTTAMFEWLLSPDQTSWIKRLMKPTTMDECYQLYFIGLAYVFSIFYLIYYDYKYLIVI